MINTNELILAFISGNWMALGLVYAILLAVVKATPGKTDDTILAAVKAWWDRIRGQAPAPEPEGEQP